MSIFGNCIQESLFRNHSMKCCVKMLKIGLIYLSKKHHLVGLKIQLPSEELGLYDIQCFIKDIRTKTKI